MSETDKEAILFTRFRLFKLFDLNQRLKDGLNQLNGRQR
jgi:hypothetical protein